MFCPQCRCEYRAGFLRCADCGLALVATLEPEVDEMSDGGHSWITFPIREAAMLTTARSLLEGSSIPFHVVGDFGRRSIPTIVVPEPYASDVETLLAELLPSR